MAGKKLQVKSARAVSGDETCVWGERKGETETEKAGGWGGGQKKKSSDFHQGRLSNQMGDYSRSGAEWMDGEGL